MGHEKRILIVSCDVRVLQTRKLMLGAYFDVYPAGRVGEAARYLSEHSFHLIILCYSLSEEDSQKILNAARQRSAGAAVLVISPNGHISDHIPGALHISTDEGPLALLKRSAQILGFEFRTRGRLVHALQPHRAAERLVQRCA